MSGPLVTALVPVKSFHPEYLRRAVGSLLAQDGGGWRALVISDPSVTDGVEAVLAAELADPRIEIVVCEGARLAGALNTGMRRATTEFVAILLGDDLWAPEAVRVLGEAIAAHPEGDFFHSARAIVDGSDAVVSRVYPAREAFGTADFVAGSPVKHLLCWRRELGLANGGVDETLEEVGTDDWDFTWTMAEAGARFVAVPECLYLYRDHRDCPRLTTDVPLSEWLRGRRRIRDKHGVRPWRNRLAAVRAWRLTLRHCFYRTPLDRPAERVLGTIRR